MSQSKLSAGIEEMTGKLNSKTRVIMRVKRYKNDKGKVIKVGPQETYVKDPRDYQKNPRTAAEELQAIKWKAACAAASEIIKDKNHPRYADLRARWNAQFEGHPEPLFQVPGKPKVIYGMFPVFVRMVLLREGEKE